MARAAILLAVAALVLAPAAVATTDAASLKIVPSSPLTITGAHFKRHERVKVTVAGSGFASHTRHAKATRAGRLTVTFTQLTATPCRQMTVTALGSMGSQAQLASKMHPDCLAN